MTQFKPCIFINRFVIMKDNHVAYNERFHKGVNIIRGRNSSGKSTVLDLLFFGLGGAITEKQWKGMALKCTSTLVEVTINAKVFVLSREISTNAREGMKFFEGSYEHSQTVTISDWLFFPYASTADKESYHDNLLKLLSIPLTQSNDDNNININFNQVLRLIYTDQLSNISRIFREEMFDSSLKREAIGDLMLGISSDENFIKKLELNKAEKNLDKLVSNIKSFTSIYQGIRPEVDIKNIITDNTAEINRLTELYEIPNNEETDDERDLEVITQKRIELDTLIKQRPLLIEDINKRTYEIQDSQEFIESLKKRLINIKESNKALSILSDIEFIYCPSCFTPINANDEHLCTVCKHPKNDDYEEPTFRIQKDIEFQISETSSLIPKLEKELEMIYKNYSFLIAEIEKYKKELSILEKPTGISAEKKTCLLSIGALEHQNETLIKEINTLSNFYNLQKTRDDCQGDVNALRDEVNAKESFARTKRESKKQLLANITLALLKQDIADDDDFLNAKELTFSLKNDLIRVDDISVFSASSTAFLKNAFKVSLLIASCKDKSFLYPRLAIIDNVEDKGMEVARSRNFQKIVVDESEKLDVEHQIILSTSMINVDYDNENYCVGGFYTPENRTLNIIG